VERWVLPRRDRMRPHAHRQSKGGGGGGGGLRGGEGSETAVVAMAGRSGAGEVRRQSCASAGGVGPTE
jgi:hypothetical protein